MCSSFTEPSSSSSYPLLTTPQPPVNCNPSSMNTTSTIFNNCTASYSAMPLLTPTMSPRTPTTLSPTLPPLLPPLLSCSSSLSLLVSPSLSSSSLEVVCTASHLQLLKREVRGHSRVLTATLRPIWGQPLISASPRTGASVLVLLIHYGGHLARFIII